MCKKFDISPITAMVNIHKKSLSRTMATYFQSSRTLLESSARLTLSLSILDLKIYLHTHKYIYKQQTEYMYVSFITFSSDMCTKTTNDQVHIIGKYV